ncbi:hypothetical protein Ae505Ps2_6169c [Pseudonocardia sp. Ae505_Ps2]|nr:hypothetical protein Ae505Ps2_6169c [Pseudonocardia sp. Ae505_Ps2]
MISEVRLEMDHDRCALIAATPRIPVPVTTEVARLIECRNMRAIRPQIRLTV